MSALKFDTKIKFEDNIFLEHIADFVCTIVLPINFVCIIINERFRNNYDAAYALDYHIF